MSGNRPHNVSCAGGRKVAKPCPWCKGRVELIPNTDSEYGL